MPDTLVEYFQSLHAAAEVSMDPAKPLKLYLRSAEMVFKQVCARANSPH